LGEPTGSAKKNSSRRKRGFVNLARVEGLSAVGLLHSSDETGESQRSEGGNKPALLEGKHGRHKEVKELWKKN